MQKENYLCLQKQNRKLRLNRETVRGLTVGLEKVRGGGVTDEDRCFTIGCVRTVDCVGPSRPPECLPVILTKAKVGLC